jgi:YD repeat-containing protein
MLTVTGAVQVLTPSKYIDSVIPDGALGALITNEGETIRYTYDGTTPSATVGHRLADGGMINLMGQNQISQFKCSSVSGNSLICVTYERE